MNKYCKILAKYEDELFQQVDLLSLSVLALDKHVTGDLRKYTTIGRQASKRVSSIIERIRNEAMEICTDSSTGSHFVDFNELFPTSTPGGSKDPK